MRYSFVVDFDFWMGNFSKKALISKARHGRSRSHKTRSRSRRTSKTTTIQCSFVFSKLHSDTFWYLYKNPSNLHFETFRYFIFPTLRSRGGPRFLPRMWEYPDPDPFPPLSLPPLSLGNLWKKENAKFEKLQFDIIHIVVRSKVRNNHQQICSKSVPAWIVGFLVLKLSLETVAWWIPSLCSQSLIFGTPSMTSPTFANTRTKISNQEIRRFRKVDILKIFSSECPGATGSRTRVISWLFYICTDFEHLYGHLGSDHDMIYPDFILDEVVIAPVAAPAPFPVIIVSFRDGRPVPLLLPLIPSPVFIEFRKMYIIELFT